MKTLKKYASLLAAVALALTMSVSFTACDDDDDDKGGGKVEIKAQNLVGVWQFMRECGEEDGEKFDEPASLDELEEYWVINSDGRMSHVVHFLGSYEHWEEAWSGSWSLDGTTLRITNRKYETDDEEEIVRLTSDELVTRSEGSWGWEEDTYKRVSPSIIPNDID